MMINPNIMDGTRINLPEQKFSVHLQLYLICQMLILHEGVSNLAADKFYLAYKFPIHEQNIMNSYRKVITRTNHV